MNLDEFIIRHARFNINYEFYATKKQSFVRFRTIIAITSKNKEMSKKVERYLPESKLYVSNKDTSAETYSVRLRDPNVFNKLNGTPYPFEAFEAYIHAHTIIREKGEYYTEYDDTVQKLIEYKQTINRLYSWSKTRVDDHKRVKTFFENEKKKNIDGVEQ